MLSNAQHCSAMLSNAQQLCSVMLLQIICSLRSQCCKMRLFVWFLPTVWGWALVARNWTVSATKHWLVGAKLMLNFKLINKKRSLDLADALLLHTPWNSKSFNINYLRTFYWIYQQQNCSKNQILGTVHPKLFNICELKNWLTITKMSHYFWSTVLFWPFSKILLCKS